MRRRMQAKLQELIPIATGVLVPPGVEDPYDYELLGYHSSETHAVRVQRAVAPAEGHRRRRSATEARSEPPPP